MVTGVSNNSANILTLFQTGKEAGTANNEETLAKIQELAKEAEQMKAGTSPAQTQGASVATNAWIAASAPPALSSAEVEKIHSAAQRAIEMYENPQPSDQTVRGLTQSLADAKFSLTITDLNTLVGEISKYNAAVHHLNGFKQAVNVYVDWFDRLNSNATSSHMGGAIDDLRDATGAIIKNLQSDLFLTRGRVNTSPSAIDNGIEYLNSHFIVDGAIATRGEDGLYRLGTFTLSYSSDYMLYKSDGSGTLFANTTTVRGHDVWTEIYSGDEWIWDRS
ncbi:MULTISPECIES: hypothetical protein [unclassified Xanthobacter]|uniref:hypothetical protein n=1 Tax=unclassified Xanthobacter TaxID=2623496 RepID=UPI001F40060E|nr:MULTISPECIES: hypothetical protein [unclassified Xanthobacter]